MKEPVNKELDWAALDLRLSWLTADKALEIVTCAQNVTNTKFRVNALDVTILSVAQSAYANPRTYGVSVRYRY